jgi:hypothetical protein
VFTVREALKSVFAVKGASAPPNLVPRRRFGVDVAELSTAPVREALFWWKFRHNKGLVAPKPRL